MSFFKDIRDELAQTVNDMEAEDQNDIDSLFSEEEETDGLEKSLLKRLFADDFIEETKEKSAVETVKELIVATAEEEQNETSVASKNSAVGTISKENNDVVTRITKGTTVNGGIITDGSVEIMGTVNGDVECLGKLTVSGTVRGNCTAAEVYLSAERLLGSIVSEGSVVISRDTVVIGNMTAASAVIAGAVKGDIDVTGAVMIDCTAVVKGNIKAKSVQVNDGAVIEGFCSLTDVSASIDNLFE